MSINLNLILKIFLFFFDAAFIFFTLLPYNVKKLLNYINGYSIFLMNLINLIVFHFSFF